MSNHPIQSSEQNVLNEVYDAPTKTLMVMPGEYDGAELQRPTSTQVAQKIVVSGSYTYVCIAPIGTAQAAEAWLCKKIDQSVAGTTIITWAGGGLFNQAATDPSGLTYA